MLACRDFAPRQKTPPHSVMALMDQGEHESFELALAAANEWIDSGRIEVLHVETVVLPRQRVWRNLLLIIRYPSWHQFIRVWYRG